MNFKKKVFLSGCVVLLACIGLGMIRKTNSQSNLSLKLETEKEMYLLGENIEVRFTLTNIGRTDISIGCFGVSTGELQIFISKTGKEFYEYNSDWGMVDAECNNVIKAGDNIKTSNVKLLWNYSPSVKHLNKDAAKEFQKGKILSHYAFDEKGVYFLKAVYNGKIESEPIRIIVNEPVGENLEIWKRIKDNENFAYFIQKSDILIPANKPEERFKFQAELDDILQKHPNSFYAQSLRQSLDKFKTVEAKRKEFFEKINNPNRPQ